MKNGLWLLLAAMLLSPMKLFGQTYQQMWKHVEEAQQKDLPRTAMEHLLKIETKAQKERAYGQLLKSTLLYARLQGEVAPDSLAPAVDRLVKEEQKTEDKVLKAVYATVLSKLYARNRQLGDDTEARSRQYYNQATADPDLLAMVKTDSYVPFVISGKDSEAFGNDLLSVVGMELDAWEWMTSYYQKVGNRRALCHLALRSADTIEQLDSLAALYGDLPEASIITMKRQNRWTVLTNPTYQAVVPQQVAMPQEQQTIKLEQLRNLQQLTMRVYRTKLTGETKLNPNQEADYKQIQSGLTELKDMAQTRTFAIHPEDQFFDDSLTLAGLPVGVYMLEFTSQPATQVRRELYFVSGIRLMTQGQPEGRTRYVVVDAVTGQPVGGAQLLLNFSNGWRKPMTTKLLTCDHQGEVVHTTNDDKRPSEVYAYTKSDNFCPMSNGWGRYSYYEREFNTEHTSLFTDRSIYRPGQTVHVTAIVWKELSAIDNIAVSDKLVKMELRDANYKVVAEKQVATDRFGKCATEFTLPTGLLNGRFTIRANSSSTSISVEEYKRPTFQVEFSEYAQSYQQGDTVRTEGKALSYAGVPVQDAKVHYTVRRRVAFWWMTYSWYWQGGYVGHGLEEEVVNEGDAVTADDGTFTVEMPMVLPADLGGRSMFYHFVVEADVTDTAGETHSGTMTLPLGTRPTTLVCDLPQQVRSDQLPKVTFNRYNAAGKETAGTVSYRIDGGKWQQCAANTPLSIDNLRLKSGQHRIEAVCDKDSLDMKFVVFGLSDKVPAATTDDWFYISDRQFPADGKPVTLQVGSSDPDMHIVYSLFAGNKVIESGTVKKSRELLNRQLTYKEAYGNGLLLTYAWVKNGRCHIHQATIRRPMPDKKLQLRWETFRNLLTPGQQEEWRLKIVTPDGTPADASLMAVLYDKSLDQLREHQWSFTPTNYLPIPSSGWQWTAWGNKTTNGSKQYKLLSIPEFSYNHFDSSVYPYYHFSVYARGSRPMMMAKQAANVNDDAYSFSASDEMAMADMAKDSREAAASQMEASAEEEKQKEQQQVQLRENLNETAFCYPQLETDKDGSVTLKFTLPESLTTWRFMGIANTAAMLCGSIEGEVVAKKDVMVQPNIPRFLRTGDDAQLSARIFNTSDHAISGQARLLLTDPETDQTVYEQSQTFAVEAGKTGAVTFTIPCEGFNTSLLVCKVMAQGDGFSDGEQHYLPVLPDREYVTKTVPYTQHEPGVKSIDLTALFPTGTTQKKLTVEYTNNPAWLMVQSLPVVGQPWEHSAIEQAASYYSNLLAKKLLAKSPQVKSVFEQWKREDASLSTLQSSLTKNQELKELVLSETPWVGAADRENEQKQQLADFFDENGISYRLATATEKLQKLQNSDGSFSWYPGMQGSTSITVAVEEMLVRLNHMAGQQAETRQMQTKAFDFIGKEMVELVAEMKKEEKKGHKPVFPSFTALRWLYLCALDGRQLSKNVSSANDYLVALLKKDIKRQSIYEKALTAIILSKRGDDKLAAQYVQSLKEFTVYTEEMGRYYDTPRAGYSWYDYKIPTEVAAIEAIEAVTPQDSQTIDEMRRWLLQEKRTQAWDTPINSVNAIWAFLNGNNHQLTTDNTQPTVLAIDGTPVSTSKATAGIGYVKTAINDPQGQTFTATKTSEGTSWGAVYAQFMQKTSEVEASPSGITVKRELLTASGQKVTGALTVGSRVKVRITIDTTRDLDFVQVVDRRAASMEPVRQLSGYQNGAYVSPKDYATSYYYYGLAKGRHMIETEYYIDRAGHYETGTCSVQCAYSPEFRATAPSMTIHIKQ